MSDSLENRLQKAIVDHCGSVEDYMKKHGAIPVFTIGLAPEENGGTTWVFYYNKGLRKEGKSPVDFLEAATAALAERDAVQTSFNSVMSPSDN
jgi:hypothetical protein